VLSVAVRADFFDASALVKVFSREPGSDIALAYFNSRPTKHTTAFCFYEAMNVLKSKWKSQGRLSREEYLAATFQLTAWFGASAARVRELDFTDPLVFGRATDLVQRHALDYSDAFQILSVRDGYFSSLVGESSTVLATADRGLASAARAEGLRVWNMLDEPPP
jgi:predicted nucleic acid-binding protein